MQLSYKNKNRKTVEREILKKLKNICIKKYLFTWQIKNYAQWKINNFGKMEQKALK